MSAFIGQAGGGSGGATTFTQLTDVPNSYVGQAGKTLIVNPGETALIFAAAPAAAVIIGSPVTGGTVGSVLFVGAGATLAQDNPNFFWDDTNNFLGIGTNTPTSAFQIFSAADVDLTLSGTGLGASAVKYQNGLTEVWRVGRGALDGGLDFQFYNYTAATSLVCIQESTGFVGIGTTAPTVPLHVIGDAHITGKLTVDGAIDPPSLSLSGGTALFIDSADGATAPLSAAAHGRIRYNNGTLQWEQSVNGGAYTAFGGGSGTVTSVSVTTTNGVSGVVATPTTTPAITLTLGNITPTTVNALTLTAQAVGFTIAGGTTSKTLTVPLDATVSGINTGDQTITLTGEVTGSGTGSFATTIANQAVTYSKIQNVTTNKLLGRATAGSGVVEEITLGTNLSFTGTTLNAATGSNQTLAQTLVFGNVTGGTSISISAGDEIIAPANQDINLHTTGLGLINAKSLAQVVVANSNNKSFGIWDQTTQAIGTGPGFTFYQGASGQPNANISVINRSGTFYGSDMVFNVSDTSGTVNFTPLQLSHFGSVNIGGQTASTVTGQLNWSTGLGSIVQILGPSDVPLTIGTLSNQNVVISPNGTADLIVNADTTINGKLTVTGIIDPTALLLSGSTDLYLDSTDGSTAAVSAAGHGRIRYLNPTGWQVSVNGGAYQTLSTSGPQSLATTLLVGNTTSGTNIVVTGGDSITAPASTTLQLLTTGTGAINLRGTAQTLVANSSNSLVRVWDNSAFSVGVGPAITFFQSAAGLSVGNISCINRTGASAGSDMVFNAQIPIVGLTNVFELSHLGSLNIGGHTTSAVKGQLNWADSLTAIVHLLGPTDQPFTVGTLNNQNFVVSPNGTGTMIVNSDVTITGKLTVVGAIDPPSLTLSGGTALFIESFQGNTAAVSSSNSGRIRYNDTLGRWQVSTQASAYANVLTTTVGLTTGSVLFANAGVISQDNANFFWDDTNNRLGIGNNAPTDRLHITGTTLLEGNTVVASGGGASISCPQTAGSSNEAFGTSITLGSMFIAAMGDNITVGTNSQSCMVFGFDNTVGNNSGNMAVIGQFNNISDNSADGVCIGRGNTISNDAGQSVCIGGTTLVGSNSNNSVVIGVNSGIQSSSTNGTVVGHNANIGANINNGIAIGESSLVTDQGGIAIGSGATAGLNQFVSGSATSTITNVYFGSGASSATPTNYTINGTAGNAITINGGRVTLAGGLGGDPTDTGGDVRIAVAITGAAQTLVDTIFVSASNGNVGIGAAPGAFKLDVTGDTRLFGGQVVKTTTVTTTYSILSSDYVIFADPSGGAFTITLPNAATQAGMIFRVKDSSGTASTNNLTIDTAGGNIDGSATFVISTNYAAAEFCSDGTNWFIT